MPLSPDPLRRVKRAAAKLDAARSEYRAALLACLDAGYSYAEIARTLGVSRQAVRQLAERN